MAKKSEDSKIKRVLRHRASQAYFKDGAWTRNAEEADCFEDVEQIAETCLRYNLSGVELALRLQAGKCDVFCTAIR
jgi:hypothetical protein